MITLHQFMISIFRKASNDNWNQINIGFVDVLEVGPNIHQAWTNEENPMQTKFGFVDVLAPTYIKLEPMRKIQCRQSSVMTYDITKQLLNYTRVLGYKEIMSPYHNDGSRQEGFV